MGTQWEPIPTERVPLSTGLQLHLDSMRIHQETLLADGPSFVGNVLVDSTASIGAGCKIGPDVRSVQEDYT